MWDTEEKRLKRSERTRVETKKFRLVFLLFPMQDPSEKQTAVGRVVGWPSGLVALVVVTPSRR